jgi:hypothetical protein
MRVPASIRVGSLSNNLAWIRLVGEVHIVSLDVVDRHVAGRGSPALLLLLLALLLLLPGFSGVLAPCQNKRLLKTKQQVSNCDP